MRYGVLNKLGMSILLPAWTSLRELRSCRGVGVGHPLAVGFSAEDQDAPKTLEGASLRVLCLCSAFWSMEGLQEQIKFEEKVYRDLQNQHGPQGPRKAWISGARSLT